MCVCVLNPNGNRSIPRTHQLALDQRTTFIRCNKTEKKDDLHMRMRTVYRRRESWTQLLHKEGLNVASDLVHQDGVDRTVSPLGMLANPVPHFGPKTFPICHEVIGGLDVERIVKVEQIVEERVEAPDNVPKSSSGCPTHTVHYTNREKTFQTLCSIVLKKNFRRICSVSWSHSTFRHGRPT